MEFGGKVVSIPLNEVMSAKIQKLDTKQICDYFLLIFENNRDLQGFQFLDLNAYCR